MMCGLAGSGKSSLSHAIVAAHPEFTRLSVDGIQYEKYGSYNVDYDPALYERYQEEANEIYEERLADLLAQGKDIVLDRSFYAKDDRDAFKERMEGAGARWLLVYHRCTDIERLWKRLEDRKARKGTLGGEREGDATFDVTREILQQYWDGWEAPEGEGEIVFDVV